MCQSCDADADASGGACFQVYTSCANDTFCVQLLECLQSCTAKTDCDACVSNASSLARTRYDSYRSCICDTACASECATACAAMGPV
jgi:hypothetical protein